MNQHLERLEGVSPVIRTAVQRLCELSETKLRQPLLIVRGWASMMEQLQAYQRGRVFNREMGDWEVSDASLIVTKAKPGRSAHNVITLQTGQPASMAVDVIPLLTTGLPNWEIPDVFWEHLYELAWKCGLDPLGDQIGSYLAGDKGHFEEPCWQLKLVGLGLVLPTAEVPHAEA